GHRTDVGFRAALAGAPLDAQGCERLGNPRDRALRVVGNPGVEAVDAPGAEVAFGHDRVAGDLVGMRPGIGEAAMQALLLVGEGDHADAARWALRERGDQPGRSHGDADAGGVVDRAGALVPGVQVAADQHDLVRPAAAGDLADHVL